MGKTRIYYCCDIHASNVCFRKILNATKNNLYKANVVIVGGDLTGKRIIPIAKQANGEYTCDFLEKIHVMKSDEELAEMQKLIGNSGFYPYLLEFSQVGELRTNRKWFDALITELILKRMDEWMKLADERLAGIDTQFYMLPGNDDDPKCGEIITSSKLVKNPDGRVVNLDGVHEMISSGASNATPWKTPGEFTEVELEAMFEKMISNVKDPRNLILNLHVPPYDSGLDVAPKLNEQLQPVLVGGEFMRIPVGSTAVRKIIQKYQPKLGLFGHIHEAGGDVFIGKTLCVNPGSEYSEGILRGYVVDLDDKGIKQFYRVEG
jgi:Icc-related predicted phosphoesterase